MILFNSAFHEALALATICLKFQCGTSALMFAAAFSILTGEMPTLAKTFLLLSTEKAMTAFILLPVKESPLCKTVSS